MDYGPVGSLARVSGYQSMVSNCDLKYRNKGLRWIVLENVPMAVLTM